MKLYYSPGACSLAPHMVLRELGLKFQLERMDGKTHKTESGTDFYTINPKGSVPTLVLDDGQVLTENAVILQYLADQAPAAKLAPPAGSMERYRLMEWLNFIATDVHKGFSPLYNPKLNDESRQALKEKLVSRIGFAAKHLEGRRFLMEKPSVADFYLFAVLRWTKKMEIDIGRWPSLRTFMDQIAARPAVKAALEAEGLSWP